MKSLIPVFFGLTLIPGCSANEMINKTNEIRFDCAVNAAALENSAIVLDCQAINISEQTIKLLPWNTPIEGQLMGHYLIIENDQGESLDYRGIMVKRAAPTESDYAILEPGEVIDNSVDLTLSYSFCPDMQYKIDYSGTQWTTEGNEIKLWMPPVKFSSPSSIGECE